MDTALVVALIGTGTTLLAGVVGPLAADTIRHRHARAELLMDRRIEAYADLLAATSRLADNAMTWSSVPLADLQETDNEVLDRLISRVRVIAGKDVRRELDTLTRLAHQFNAKLLFAKLNHQREIDEAKAGVQSMVAGENIVQRLDLGKVADQMVASAKRIEEAVRKDVDA